MTWFHGVPPGVRNMLPAVCNQECLSSARDFDQEKSYRPYLTLLLTCRTIYAIALRVMYSSNVFCFIPRGNIEAGGLSLTKFCASLSAYQGAWLTTLYIRTWTRCSHKKSWALEAYSVPKAWKDLVQDDQKGLKKLTGLAKLTVEFVRTLTEDVPRSWAPVVDVFDGLKDLNLTTLDVLIWDLTKTDSSWVPDHRPAFAANQEDPWWDAPEYQSLGRRFRQRFLGLAVEAPLSSE